MLQRIATICMAFLIVSSFSFAQEWQWERFEGDYRNPTGFPGIPSCIGDFDGNGSDDLFYVSMLGWSYSTIDENADDFHWLPPDSSTVGFDVFGMSTAFDVDGDGADELIRWPYYSSSEDTVFACWKLVSTNPWTWERRDELLDPWMDFGQGYEFIEGVFGDIDGDGLMNFVCEAPYDCICTGLDVWEYDSEGHPTLEYTYFSHSWFGRHYVIGDPDRDGDDDLLCFADSIYSPGYEYLLLMFENTGENLDDPIELSSYRYHHCEIADLNGDGQDELLLSTIRQVEPTNYEDDYSFQINLAYLSDSFDILTLNNLSPFRGKVFGNLRPGDGTFSPVAGTANWFEETHYGLSLGTLEQYYTPNGWEDFNSGIEKNGLTYCTGFYDSVTYSSPSMLQVFSSFQSGNIVPSWETYELYHMTDGDYLIRLGGAFYLHRFYQNPDTLFFSPQLGNISGDGNAEYFMLAEVDDQPSEIMIFEVHGAPWEDPVQNESLSVGLPTGIKAIRVADLDGDGDSEILARTDQSHWSLYYYEGDRWYDYSTVLPDFESTELGFADFDNNGIMDIFTDDDVWLSLSPSPATDDLILSPSSFSLSSYPNPFNPATTIRFNLPDAGKVSLDVYNIRGQLVQSLLNQPMTAGDHSCTFDGSALPSGVYFANLSTTERTTAHKLLLLK